MEVNRKERKRKEYESAIAMKIHDKLTGKLNIVQNKKSQTTTPLSEYRTRLFADYAPHTVSFIPSKINVFISLTPRNTKNDSRKRSCFLFLVFFRFHESTLPQCRLSESLSLSAILYDGDRGANDKK